MTDDWGRANPDNLGDYERYVLSAPTSEQLRERADLQRKAMREDAPLLRHGDFGTFVVDRDVPPHPFPDADPGDCNDAKDAA